MELKGRTALITGGSRGIGKACVELFLRAGANVAFTYSNAREKAQNIISGFRGTSRIQAFELELLDSSMIEKIVDDILNEFESIDILVNSAGIWKEASIDKMSLNDWNETININLTSAYLLTRYVVPGMKQNKFGRIINISSTAGQRGEAFHSHYAASKGGMISFTKSLAAELGIYNITVNCVAPGWVITDMTKEALEDPNCSEKIIGDIPLKKIALPEEIAGPVLFLASGLASHITGEILNVNGGSVLCG
ncbi:3-oxoacyl-ACP reductase FabG [Candidatus Parcubacteria bacterium]|nr:MAG: 3-oxoacyl-ACP reductase FabG [Candidatus Parcubacteria bacterium]